MATLPDERRKCYHLSLLSENPVFIEVLLFYNVSSRMH